jgi:ABC-type branched-subunit amino acid transport system ATPase component
MKNKLILQVNNICKSFGGVKAVDGVSFDLHQGEAIGIIGPNGSGKSTMINLITGFISATSGQVIFQGQDITKKPPHKRVKLGIARSFQMARPFYNLSVFRNLVIPLYSPRAKKLKGGKYGNLDEAAIHMLEDVGFERDSQVPYKAAGALPHGYLKRLELARCLSLDPDLIILDELFSGMSMSEIASILPLLEKIREEGKTLIMVEHRLSELFRITDRAVVLNFGKKIADGTPAEVIKNKEVASAYLGSEINEDDSAGGSEVAKGA